jgi:hypothetical protein
MAFLCSSPVEGDRSGSHGPAGRRGHEFFFELTRSRPRSSHARNRGLTTRGFAGTPQRGDSDAGLTGRLQAPCRVRRGVSAALWVRCHSRKAVLDVARNGLSPECRNHLDVSGEKGRCVLVGRRSSSRTVAIASRSSSTDGLRPRRNFAGCCSCPFATESMIQLGIAP